MTSWVHALQGCDALYMIANGNVSEVYTSSLQCMSKLQLLLV